MPERLRKAKKKAVLRKPKRKQTLRSQKQKQRQVVNVKVHIDQSKVNKVSRSASQHKPSQPVSRFRLLQTSVPPPSTSQFSLRDIVSVVDMIKASSTVPQLVPRRNNEEVNPPLDPDLEEEEEEGKLEAVAEAVQGEAVSAQLQSLPPPMTAKKFERLPKADRLHILELLNEPVDATLTNPQQKAMAYQIFRKNGLIQNSK